MALTLVTGPQADPISLASIKAHLRIDGALEDPTLWGYLTAARQHLEGRDGWLNRAFISQTWDLSLDLFPPGAALSMPLAPLQSVVSITYLDTAGLTQTMPATDYTVDTKTEPGWVAPAYGLNWPYALPVFNAVRVRFVCGYGDGPFAIPAPIRLALLGLVADFYEHRSEALFFGVQAAAAGQPNWVQAMLASYQIRVP
jgi:uncharacterized phiE125 gp8 family phage protein